MAHDTDWKPGYPFIGDEPPVQHHRHYRDPGGHAHHIGSKEPVLLWKYNHETTELWVNPDLLDKVAEQLGTALLKNLSARLGQ